MTIIFADRVKNIVPPPTLAMNAKAAALKAEGRDILNLSVGEPDFTTPEHIQEAAIQAMRDGLTKYTAVDGLPALKEAIKAKFKRENNLDYELNQICVCSGARQALYNALQALINHNDEVIIPAPYWVSYPDMSILAGATPVKIETTFEQGYKITAEQLESAITENTKVLFLNSPSNPSGKSYTLKELEALSKVLLKHPRIIIFSDDIYEHLRYNGQDFYNIVNACPDLKERTLVINGVSKAYAMTGWRIGYVAGDETIIGAMKKIQGQSTGNACSISQAAAIAALHPDNQDVIPEMLEKFKRRRDLVVRLLNDIPGLRAHPADGAFYAFCDISDALAKHSKSHDDLSFAEYLLENHGVALVPGTAFGTPGCIRISFATSEEILEDAIGRIKTALAD